MNRISKNTITYLAKFSDIKSSVIVYHLCLITEEAITPRLNASQQASLPRHLVALWQPVNQPNYTQFMWMSLSSACKRDLTTAGTAVYSYRLSCLYGVPTAQVGALFHLCSTYTPPLFVPFSWYESIKTCKITVINDIDVFPLKAVRVYRFWIL